jgi:predicted nucleic acid-binding Zn ribbon protein
MNTINLLSSVRNWAGSPSKYEWINGVEDNNGFVGIVYVSTPDPVAIILRSLQGEPVLRIEAHANFPRGDASLMKTVNKIASDAVAGSALEARIEPFPDHNVVTLLSRVPVERLSRETLNDACVNVAAAQRRVDNQLHQAFGQFEETILADMRKQFAIDKARIDAQTASLKAVQTQLAQPKPSNQTGSGAAIPPAVGKPPAAPGAGGVCMRCGVQLKPGKRFCEKCGAPLPPPKPVPTSGGFCVKCGAQIRAGKKFCEKCGAPAAQTTQPSAPTAPPTAPVCPSCGNPVPAGKKFCTKCGAKMP